jgi:hypothetical protein
VAAMDLSNPWIWFVPFYLFTISIETPVLVVGLSPRHSLGRRIFCGFWLTACTYPIVFLVLPLVFDPTTDRVRYLIVGESVAHFGECALFWAAFGTREEFGKLSMWRDLAAVFLANTASFVAGEIVFQLPWVQEHVRTLLPV